LAGEVKSPGDEWPVFDQDAADLNAGWHEIFRLRCENSVGPLPNLREANFRRTALDQRI
jgi:hypothetical protein